ncbi:hypothetical protein PAMP_018908 [Pampus punctatissimus]
MESNNTKKHTHCCHKPKVFTLGVSVCMTEKKRQRFSPLLLFYPSCCPAAHHSGAGCNLSSDGPVSGRVAGVFGSGSKWATKPAFSKDGAHAPHAAAPVCRCTAEAFQSEDSVPTSLTSLHPPLLSPLSP